jgi:FAD synthase
MSEFIETKGTIVVYPNPSTDYITLKTNNIKPADDYILKIYSITGKIIKEEMLSVPDASYEYTIPTANLPNGIYMITLSGINISYRTKFVIQN